MSRSLPAGSVLVAVLIASLWSASCMRTVVRRLECKYDAEAAAASSKGKAPGHRGAVRSLQFTGDGTRIVASGNGGRVLLWDLKTGGSREVLSERDAPVSIAFAENQQALALAAAGQAELSLFDARRGEERGTIPAPVGGSLRPFPGHAFSRDGALIALAGKGHGITLWNIKVGQPEVELAGPGAPVGDLVFSPDDELLAVAAADGSVSFWSTESGEETRSFDPLGGTPVTAIDFSADGDRIAAAGAHGEVVVTGVSADEPGLVLEECDVAGREVRALRFSPSGKAVFGVKREGCEVQFVCIWDAETGDAVAAFEVPVTDAIDFNADGSMMATGGCGCEIILWDLEVGVPAEQLGASCRLEVEGGCDD